MFRSFILNAFLLNIPFFGESLIVVSCIMYLFFCCFAKNNWWYFKIDFYLRHRIFHFFLSLLVIETLMSMCPTKEKGIDLMYFNMFFNRDYYTQFGKFLILISATFAFFWCKNFITTNSSKYTYITEFPFLFLGAVLFLFLIISANDLLATVLCIIGMSICLYSMLVANSFFGKIYREASIKYFVMSALSSGLILGGLKEIYLWCGSLKFNIMQNFILSKFCENAIAFEFLPLKISIILILFGFMFKISAAPSHFWAPEVYEGSPYTIVVFILLPIKIAIGCILIRIIKASFHTLGYGSNFFQLIWSELEFVLAFIIISSLIIGAINSVFAFKLKKFLAYSSINQIGFLLISFLNTASLFSVQTFFYFFITYIFNMVFLFASLLSILHIYHIRNGISGKNNKSILSYISDLRIIPAFDSLFSWQGVILCLSLFSLAGIPPLAGFFGKFYILIYAFHIKDWFILFIGVLTSILGAFYYLRLIKVLYFEEKILGLRYLPAELLFRRFRARKIKNTQKNTLILWILSTIFSLGFITQDISLLEVTYIVSQSLTHVGF